MRKLGITLIALSILIIVGITGYLLYAAGSSQAPPTSEEEFMAGVQGRTGTGGGGGAELAMLPPADSGQGFPILRVETEHFDMGLIKNDNISWDKMKVYNDGDAPLVISNVRTTCGCTQGKMDRTEIPPKGEGILNIRLDPFRIPGFKSTKVLTLSSNDPKNSKQEVKVSAQVDPEIELEMEQVDFKGLAQGKGGEQSFKIRQVQDKPFTIIEATATQQPGIFSASVAPVPEAEWQAVGRQEYLVTVRVSPDAPAGNHTEKFRLRFDLKRLRAMLLYATAEVQGAYALNPRSLSLRSELGANLKEVMTLTLNEDVEVVSIKSKNEFIKVSHRTGEDANSVVFDVDVAAEGTDRRIQTDQWELTLNVDDKEVTENIPVVLMLSFGEEGAEEKPAA